MFTEKDIISAYTRRQAIEDGVLVDVTETAREAGFKYPVALTCGAWGRCVAVPEGVRGSQDETGRLWDVLGMLRYAVQTDGGSGEELHFWVYVKDVDAGRSMPVGLRAVCGPDDDGSPCVTVMLEGED